MLQTVTVLNLLDHFPPKFLCHPCICNSKLKSIFLVYLYTNPVRGSLRSQEVRLLVYMQRCCLLFIVHLWSHCYKPRLAHTANNIISIFCALEWLASFTKIQRSPFTVIIAHMRCEEPGSEARKFSFIVRLVVNSDFHVVVWIGPLHEKHCYGEARQASGTGQRLFCSR